jgi:hypothetical protein
MWGCDASSLDWITIMATMTAYKNNRTGSRAKM